mmetsp:Transcript_27719/g.76322  ORF Transcript_27719/g.76322 Transcript_27719/m.76322 type:complete len:227 (+) Transcript_27719:2930-3610(+)
MERIPRVVNVHGKLCGNQRLFQVFFVAVFVANAEEHILADGPVEQVRHLRLVGDRACGHPPLTRDAIHLAHQGLQQRGLARADVSADQRELALRQLQVHIPYRGLLNERTDGLRALNGICALHVLLSTWGHWPRKGCTRNPQRTLADVLSDFGQPQEALDPVCSLHHVEPGPPASTQRASDHQESPHISTSRHHVLEIHLFTLHKDGGEASRHCHDAVNVAGEDAP